MRIIGSLANEEKASASAILGWFQKKAEWKLGTEQSLYEKFDPEHHPVRTLHQAVTLGELGSSIAAILQDWAGGNKGPVTVRTLHFPRFWPRPLPRQVEQDKQDAETTRAWARYVVAEVQAGRAQIPERALTALRQHTREPTQVQQPAPPPQSPPRRGLKQKGPSEDPRDLKLVREWYQQATRGMQLSGAAGHSQVSFSTNPSDLLWMVGGKAGAEGLARTEEVAAIVRGRRVVVDESNLVRNFRADQHGADILYYAGCLRSLYDAVSKVQRTKSTRTPEATRRAWCTVLGFPEKNTPDSERTEIRAWCRRQLSKALQGEDSEMITSMRAYLAEPNGSTSQAADPTPEREPVYTLFCKITINLVQISDDCSSS
jgi:hypothetical protein